MNTPNLAAEKAEKYADISFTRTNGSYPNRDWERDNNSYLAGYLEGRKDAIGEVVKFLNGQFAFRSAELIEREFKP